MQLVELWVWMSRGGESKEKNMTKECWICKTNTEDWVLEKKQVSGGDGVVYAGDFRDVPVHANRRECMEAKQRVEENRKRQRDPFYDVPPC